MKQALEITFRLYAWTFLRTLGTEHTADSLYNLFKSKLKQLQKARQKFGYVSEQKLKQNREVKLTRGTVNNTVAPR